ncbi:hypothetical protein BDY24DRAFT_416545 [Mrakia frigida]|uniref:uncharacterized protein n=1 Tax=Mrakia frigida TaxID=29902 RepID=UPI003FCC1F0C
MLPFSSLLPLLLTAALAQAGNTSCAAGSPTWWNNDLGDTPCELGLYSEDTGKQLKAHSSLMYENLVGRCQPEFSLFPLDATAYYFCSGTATGLTNNACCCNIAALSVLQACIFCQTGVKTLSVVAESYGTFLSSGGACTDPSAISNSSVATDVSDLDLPSWAFLPPTGDSYQWNPTVAEANATRRFGYLSSSSETRTLIAVGQSSSASTGGGKGGVNGGAIGGAIAGVLFLAAAALGWWFWRKRSRAKTTSKEPSPGWNVDDEEEDASHGSTQMAAVSPYVAGARVVPQTYHSPSVDASLPAPSSSDNRSPLLSSSHSPQRSLPTQRNSSVDHQSDGGSTSTSPPLNPQLTSAAFSSTASPDRSSGPPPLFSSSGPNTRRGGKGPLPGSSAIPTLEYSPEETYEQEVDAGRFPLPLKPEAVVDRAPPVYDPDWVER